MRQIIILLFLFFFSKENLLSQVWHLKEGETIPPGQHGIVIVEPSPNKTEIRIRCLRTLTNPDQPLIVIDGVPYDYSVLANVNPDEIESITILKGNAASAIYGYQAANGVIIIVTKQSKIRKFVVKDFLDGSLIPGATVSFISTDKKDTIRTVANDSGIVEINKLKSAEEYSITTSAVGYKTLNENFKSNYKHKENEILLERDSKVLAEIVIAPGSAIRCCFGCGLSAVKVSKTKPNMKAINYLQEENTFRIYPNPVQPGTSLNIEWKQSEEGEYILQLFNQAGQLAFNKAMWIDKDARVLNLEVPHVAAGNYFLRMTNKHSGKSYTEKIIVQ